MRECVREETSKGLRREDFGARMGTSSERMGLEKAALEKDGAYGAIDGTESSGAHQMGRTDGCGKPRSSPLAWLGWACSP